MGWPLTTCRFFTAPSLPIKAWRTTVPCIWACFARGGYWGSTLWVSNPSDTPWETRTRFNSTLGTATGELSTPPNTPPTWPPATPPGTPPTTPPTAAGALEGGAAEATSWVLTICLGILVGVRSSLGVSSCLTTGCGRAAAGAAAGGGGGSSAAATSGQAGAEPQRTAHAHQ